MSMRGKDKNAFIWNYLDLPHEIEKIFMPTMKKLLLEIDDSFDITIIDHEELPKVI